MTYRTEWPADLSDRLDLQVFLAHETGRDAAAITAAVARIEAVLTTAPASEGESREGTERVLIVPPLTIVFEPFPEAGVVVVYEAVIYPGRRV